MKKILVLFSLITLISSTETDDCTTNFFGQLQTTCGSLNAENAASCIYSENECRKQYTNCGDYSPSENFYDNICKSIKPIKEGGKYKCVPKSVGDTKTCGEELKTCSEHDSLDTCTNLDAGTEQRCILFQNGTCAAHYELCSKVEDSSKCQINIPKIRANKCEYKGNACTESERLCEDFIESFNDKYDSVENFIACFELKHEDSQRCVLYDGKCQTHYNLCTSSTKEKCKDNIPKDKNKKCILNGDTCGERDRLCEELEPFQDSEKTVSILNDCKTMSGAADSHKVCYLKLLNEDGDYECTQYLEKCEYASATECKKTKPLNDAHDGIKKLKKCDISKTDETKCEEVDKECDDYNEDNIINDCASLKKPSNNQVCFYNSQSEKCEAKYTTCEGYHTDVEVDKRVPAECEAITPDDPLKICVYGTEGTSKDLCETKTRPCNKISDRTTCHAQTFTDNANRRCLFRRSSADSETGTCFESLRKCEDYTGENINRTFCEQIEPELSAYGDGFYYGCVYTETDGTKSCSKKKLACSDYKTRLLKDHTCYSLSINIDDNADNKYKCVESKGQCIQQYTTCANYKGVGKDKGICESIILNEPKYKCILKDDKDCELELKSCSEYEGNDATECSSYKHADNKICALVNGKCIEKYPDDAVEEYHYCSNYRGKNREECERIQPYHESSTPVTIVDTSSRCVYNETYGCLRQHKKCGEARSETECLAISPENTDKQCAFIDNQCVEQYKTCKLYLESLTKNTETVDENTCINIRINDLSNTNGAEYYTTHRCEYTAPTEANTKGNCESVKRKCNEFILESVKGTCTTYIPGTSDKCVFENNACLTKPKTCLELSSVTLGLGEDISQICGNALTSSTEVICEPNSNSNGCYEKSKKNDDNQGGDDPDDHNDPKDTTNSDTSKAGECKCSSSDKYLSKILLMLLFCLLA